MNRALICIAVAACSCVAIAQNPSSQNPRSQNPSSEGPQQAEVVIVKLSPPVYPPTALAARVNGKVELALDIRPDGTVASAATVSGPAALRQAAVDSAQQTRFECKGCSDPLTRFQMIYKFALAETKDCYGTQDRTSAAPPATSSPQVTQSMNTVTITGQSAQICDPTGDRVRARSWKCAYLWKCGWR
jgi:TonB family protein